MLITSINDYSKTFLPKEIVKALDEFIVLHKQYGDNLEIGKYPLSDGAYALVSKYETKAFEDCPYETHNIMTDVQMLICGEEFIDVRPKEGLSPKNAISDPRSDLVLYNEKPIDYARVRLMPEVVWVIPPNEAHAPSICINNSSMVHKVVIKVPNK